MSLKNVLILSTVIVLAGSLVAAARSLVARRDPLKSEYPDCPFPQMSREELRIIPIDEAPSRENREAYEAYWKGRDEVRRYLRESGAMAQATPDEREAYRLVAEADEYVAGRELALKALRANPQSIPARYVLAQVEEESEGNFPLALFLVRKLRHEMHNRGLKSPSDTIAREWYLRVLELEYSILYDMARDLEQLRVTDLIEQVYQPLPSRRVWPLMRLARFDEARQWLEKAEKSGTMRLNVLNSRPALEEEDGHRDQCYESAKDAVTNIATSPILWRNFSEVCFRDFHYAEGDEAIFKATRFPRVDYWGSPFTELSWLLAQKGMIPAAWSSLTRAQEQRRQRAAYTLIADQDSFDRAAAHLFLLLGRGTDAYQWAKRSHEQAGRKHFSGETRDFEVNSRFFLWVTILHRQRELKDLEAMQIDSGSKSALEGRGLDLERWTLEKEMLKLLQDKKFLIELFRPLAPGNAYLYDVATPNTLFLPDVNYLVPRGVAWEAIRQARREETHAQAAPYFDAMEAELSWRDGNAERALELATRSRDQLSRTYDRCLRARLAVIAAICVEKLGRSDDVMPLYDEALEACPVVFRILEAPLPITIVDDGSGPARLWADRILASRRFRAHPRGFTMTLSSAGGQLAFELFRLKSVRHCAGNVPVVADREGLLGEACQNLLSRMMSPSLELTAIDINLLDNSLFAAPQTTQANPIGDLLRRLLAPE
ncbi:MAG: hypothetical protein ACLQGP_03485 [Isosphaeraceae bacterium]